jgi:hypothetical protein
MRKNQGLHQLNMSSVSTHTTETLSKFTGFVFEIRLSLRSSKFCGFRAVDPAAVLGYARVDQEFRELLNLPNLGVEAVCVDLSDSYTRMGPSRLCEKDTLYSNNHE